MNLDSWRSSADYMSPETLLHEARVRCARAADAAQEAAYFEGRACGMLHEKALEYSHRVYATVRRALGFTYP